nr:S8 family serine peptidase [Paenibacillus artemisiicola]
MAWTLSVPAAAAADPSARKLTVSAVSPTNAAAKISPQVTDRFDDDEYVTYLIKMKEQADPAAASSQARQKALKDKVTPAAAKLSMRNAVIGSLRETAFRTQSSLESYLKQAKASHSGIIDYKSFFIVNALAVTSTKAEMEQIARRPEVDKILPNTERFLDKVQKTEDAAPPESASPGAAAATAAKEAAPLTENAEWNIDYVNAPQVWDEGIDGTGIVVASLDTGVDYTHPALERKWRAYENGEIVHPELSWYDAHSGAALPEDNVGHGTHTMGTMVGSEENGTNKVGVAPGAKWISVRIFDPSTTDAIILDAGQWILAPVDGDGNLHPELAPDIVNNSWGGGAGIDEFFRPIVQAWRSAGIFPEFSAGNTTPDNPGGPGSVANPANYPESFATGATDSNGMIAPFSLLGPSPYGELKPEVSAPGANIRSSVPGGGYEGGWNGTSMAGPITSGIAALMLQANHSLTVDDIAQILEDTATPRTDASYPESPNQAYGYGIVNALDAVGAITTGIGTVAGKVRIGGNDDEAPVIDHTPIPVLYGGKDALLAAAVTDNVSVTQVEAFARIKGTEEYVYLPMTRAAGDYKSGQYHAIIPAYLLDPAGLEYYIRAADYANNRTETPVYAADVSSGLKPGYVQDFEGAVSGFESGGYHNTWTVGEPFYDKAYSGSKVAASNLGEHYMTGANAYFLAPPIDLTDSPEGAVLSFKNWYDIGSDHAVVYLATEQSSGEFIEQLHFTGKSDGWKTEFLDLRPYAGQRVQLLFNLFANDFGGTGGWYLDDLSVQAPDQVPPGTPTGLSGGADPGGNVALAWEPAADEDVAGYAVYRAAGDGPFEAAVTTKANHIIDTAAVAGAVNRYKVAAVDYSGNESEPSEEFSVDLTSVSEIFKDTFDGPDDNGWTHGGSGDEWERGTPANIGPDSAVSPPNVWGTDLDDTYSDSSDNALVSPEIDLSQWDNAAVFFSNWYNLESGYDYGRFEITTDGGATWTELASFNGSSYDNQWELFGYDLAPYAHQQVRFRFHLQSDSIVNMAGWYVDNFKVVGTSAPPAITQANHVSDGAPAPKAHITKPMYEPKATTKEQSGAVQPSETPQPTSLPASATVTVLETNRSVKTNPATGEYAIKHVAGDYHLQVETYGYYPQTKPVTIADNASATVNFDLEAIPTGQITGVITDERTKQPVADANVMVMEDANIAPVRTDANGAFSLTVLEGAYTLAVSAGEYYAKSVTVTAPPNGTAEANVALKPFVGAPSGLGYDDGTAEDAHAFYDAGNGWAVRMTPAAGRAKVTGASFRFWDTSWPVPGATPFQYAVYDASGSDGSPGRLLAGPFPAEALRTGEDWTNVTFPTPVEVEGEFYVAYIQVGSYPNTPGLATDVNGTNALRSWQVVGGGWAPAPEDDGNYMIRATINNEVTAPVITSPAAGTYTNDAAIEVTGTLPIDGATVTLYNGDAKAGTAAVENGTFAIPVQLKAGLNSLSAEATVDGKTTERSAPTDVTLDTVLPSLTVATPTEDFKKNQEALTIKGTATDDYPGGVTVNGEAAEVGEGGAFTHRILLNPGANAVTVVAKDLAGNETTVTRTVRLDLDSPAIADVTPAEDAKLFQGDSLSVSFKSDPGLHAAFRVELPIAPASAKANEIAMTESKTTPGLYEGTYKTPDSLILDGGVIVVRAWDDAGNETEAAASGKLFVNVDPAWELVNQAKADYKANVVNTTELNKPVLAFPDTEGITYAVTGSSSDKLISKTGVLLKRPDGATDVELTVTIAAADKPAVKAEVKTKVTLTAVPSGPIGGGGSPGVIIVSPPDAGANPALKAVLGSVLTQAPVKPAVKTEGATAMAVIADADLQQALKTVPAAIVVTIDPSGAQQAVLRLTPAQVALLAGSNPANVLAVTNGTSAVAIPVGLLAKAPKDAGLQVTLAAADSSGAAFASAASGITVLGKPAAFGVNVVQGTAVKPLALSGKDFVKQAFTLPKGTDVKAAGVLYAGSPAVNPAPAAFAGNDDGTVTVTVTRPGFATYAAVTRAITFTDIAGSAAKEQIAALASKFLIDGTSASTFSPGAAVTRAEFAALLTRALGLPAGAGLPFKDVTADKWYADEVGAAYQAGLITGLGGGSFNPNGTITHQDLAVMLERAAALVGLNVSGSASPTFADAGTVSGYAEKSVQAVTAAGLMSGAVTGGSAYFAPKAPTTREEAALAIYNLLKQSGLIN